MRVSGQTARAVPLETTSLQPAAPSDETYPLVRRRDCLSSLRAVHLLNLFSFFLKLFYVFCTACRRGMGATGSGRWGPRVHPAPQETRGGGGAQDTIRHLEAEITRLKAILKQEKDDCKLAVDAANKKNQVLEDAMTKHVANKRSVKARNLKLKRENAALKAEIADESWSGEESSDEESSDEEGSDEGIDMSETDDDSELGDVMEPEPTFKFKVLAPDKESTPQAQSQGRKRRAQAVHSLLTSGGEHGINVSGPTLDPAAPPATHEQRAMDKQQVVLECVVAYVLSSGQEEVARALAAAMVRKKPGVIAEAYTEAVTEGGHDKAVDRVAAAVAPGVVKKISAVWSGRKMHALRSAIGLSRAKYQTTINILAKVYDRVAKTWRPRALFPGVPFPKPASVGECAVAAAE